LLGLAALLIRGPGPILLTSKLFEHDGYLVVIETSRDLNANPGTQTSPIPRKASRETTPLSPAQKADGPEQAGSRRVHSESSSTSRSWSSPVGLKVRLRYRAWWPNVEAQFWSPGGSCAALGVNADIETPRHVPMPERGRR
jgi:hypothetical protein